MKCKDCRYFDTEDGKEGYCQEFIYPVNDRCFCNIDAEPPEKPKPDLVEVVRCRDCKFFLKNVPCVGGTYTGCGVLEGRDGSELEVEPDFFCAYGERRDDE